MTKRKQMREGAFPLRMSDPGDRAQVIAEAQKRATSFLSVHGDPSQPHIRKWKLEWMEREDAMTFLLDDALSYTYYRYDRRWKWKPDDYYTFLRLYADAYTHTYRKLLGLNDEAEPAPVQPMPAVEPATLWVA